MSMSGKQVNALENSKQHRLLKQPTHDPYKSNKKLVESTYCVECKALYSHGHWQWTDNLPDILIESMCPACRRINDKVPAGYLNLNGPFFEEHRDEILHLVANYASTRTVQRPLSRLIKIVEAADGGARVSFTDMRLPRAIGDAIHRAYKGTLKNQFSEEFSNITVFWSR
jgi:hypothetical protein